MSKKEWCLKCGRPKTPHMAWCDACYEKVVKDLKARQALPVGGQCFNPNRFLEGRRPARPPSESDQEERRACYELIAWMQRQLTCKGSGGPLRDDASPWQENAIRALEDGADERG